MIALVHSHVKSSFVRRQLLKLDNLYHMKVSIWKHRKMYKLRKSDSCAQCFSYSHIFTREKERRGSLRQLEPGFWTDVFHKVKEMVQHFPSVGPRALIQQTQGFFHSAGREGGSAYYTRHLFTIKNMCSELVGKRELSEYLWRDIPEVWAYLPRHFLMYGAETLDIVKILLNLHIFCSFPLLCNWSTFLLQWCCDITSASDMFLNCEIS